MKCIRISLLTAALSLPAISANATGIPTVDVASITQMVVNAQQQAQQALAQLNEAKNAIAQAKSQYEHYKGIMEGNNKLGDFLNDPTLNQLLPTKDWRDIYNNVKDLSDLRERYGLTSNDPNVQAAFDKLLSQAGVLENAYDASNDRIKNAQALRDQLNLVQTPADREQLGLRYQQELLELQNQQIQLQNAKMLMEQQDKIENKKRAQDFEDYMLGKNPVRPHYD